MIKSVFLIALAAAEVDGKRRLLYPGRFVHVGMPGVNRTSGRL